MNINLVLGIELILSGVIMLVSAIAKYCKAK